MNLKVFGFLVAYGIDSDAVMMTSVFMTIRILWPKWSGPKVVILSGVYCTLQRLIFWKHTSKIIGLPLLLPCSSFVLGRWSLPVGAVRSLRSAFYSVYLILWGTALCKCKKTKFSVTWNINLIKWKNASPPRFYFRKTKEVHHHALFSVM